MTLSDDPHTLTGAYVTHALDDEERAAVERHLAVCPSCAQEVRELGETAVRLGLAQAAAPRRAMKDDVLARIATVRQEVPRPEARTEPGAAPRRTRLATRWALAACVAAATVFGSTAVWQHQRAEDAREEAQRTQAQAQELAAVLAAPDAKARTGRLAGGASGTVVVSAGLDRAAFVASDLPKPPRGKVYQLWFNDAGSMRAAGLLDPGKDTEALLMDGSVGRASGMGITVEPAGGSPEPTSDPVALMEFPA
ncbi:Regulator of SigK OS=Streptomyces alboniger OX=132473 GN=CP975_34650 PE=4 SV=1 [Streptomyces alboniger]